MTSIRRLLSGISTPATWAARYEVTAPVRQQPTAPVEPVRRGFSDHSDFQSAEEVEHSLLGAHAPSLAGTSRKTREALRVYAGLSDFQATLPRYQHLLGTNVPPPPARYWEAAARARSTPAPEAREEPRQSTSTRPGLAATADLEKALAQTGEEDSVLLYAAEGAEGGRLVVQHADGGVTDPAAPERRFADVKAWEAAHPGLTQAATLSRNDLELVLAMPEGEARDEVLAELASANTFSASEASGTSAGDFMPSLEDLPVNAEPEADVASADGFLPSVEDLPSSSEPVEALASAEDVPLSAEELEALLSLTGEQTEGQSPLDVAVLVARRGTPEQLAHAATALYERSQAPGAGEAAAWQRGAALTASVSPEATQALLQRVGEASMADFVRTVMQA